MSSVGTVEAVHSPVSHALSEPTKLPRKRPGGLSIQSKLLIMLLSVSVISSSIVGVIGYVNGRESLREAAVDQLTTIRELRVGELESAMAEVQTDVVVDSRNLSAQTASEAINAGWDDLQSRGLPAEQLAQLQAYYTDTFNPELEARTGETYSPTAFVPQSNAGRWAQLYLTVGIADPGQTVSPDSIADGIPYMAATTEYGDYFTRLADEVG